MNAYAAVFFGTIEYCYNISFLAFILFKIKNSVRSGYMPKKTFHVVALAAAFGFTIFQGLKGKLGRNDFGTCSLIKNKKPQG